MSKIKILDSRVADQIAAGEVVERPSSAIKELIENALDAGATFIKIRVEGGGLALLEVEDNGVGMSEADAKLSVKRYATSKVSSIDDVFCVASFGFRGEALAAISAVSEFSISTKTESAPHGTLVKVSAGNIEEVSAIPANTGTIISIKNLFAPTPARLKSMKSETSEFSAIFREISAFALQFPACRFEVHKNQKLFRDFLPKSSQGRAAEVLGIEETALMPISFESKDMQFRGFLGIPTVAMSTKKKQFFFVNHRRIEDFRLSYAIREGFMQACGLEKHLHPVCVLFLQTDPILVDCNVHPRKIEVRFSEPQDTFWNTKLATIKTLEKNAGMPISNIQTQFSTEKSSGTVFPKSSAISQNQHRSSAAFGQILSQGFSARNNSRDSFTPSGEITANGLVPTKNLAEEPIEFSEENLALTALAQIEKKYILAQSSAGIWLFDQHALHERQRFELFWNEFLDQKRTQKIAAQKLLLPEKVSLELDEISTIFEPKNQKVLNSFGFSFNLLDDETLEVLSIPQVLNTLSGKEIFESFAHHFQKQVFAENMVEQFMRKKLEYKSCRGAIMFGDSLTKEEMQKLLDDFPKTQWRNLCPHGRPNHVFYSFSDLDKAFHR